MHFIPKLHYLFHDIPYYIAKYGALGKYDEQPCEGAHQAYKPVLANAMIDVNNPDFDKCLLMVRTLDSRNI